MTSPLLAKTKLTERKEHRAGRAMFHRRVFARWGNKCWFCGDKATDAMHIVDRNELGKHSRWAVPEENGRPGCRECHTAQTAHRLHFSMEDKISAMRALNPYMKKKFDLELFG